MFLTSDEIKELTKRTQYRAQAQMLNYLGITHKVRSDGTLLVLRAHVEKEMGGLPDSKTKVKEFQPNWDMANA